MQIYQADFCNENEMCVFIYTFILLFTYLSISLAEAFMQKWWFITTQYKSDLFTSINIKVMEFLWKIVIWKQNNVFKFSKYLIYSFISCFCRTFFQFIRHANGICKVFFHICAVICYFTRQVVCFADYVQCQYDIIQILVRIIKCSPESELFCQ